MGRFLAGAFVAVMLGGGCLCWIAIIGNYVWKTIKGQP
jgi:hypothetical protein